MNTLLKSSVTIALLFLNCNATIAQKEIASVVLTPEINEYLTKAGYDFLKMDGEGNTYPTNDYKIFFNEKSGSVQVSRNFVDYISKSKPLKRGLLSFFC